MIETNRWIVAVIVICCGVLIGRISSRLARVAFSPDRERPEVAEFGPSMARVLNAAALAISALIALAALDPDSFASLPDKALDIVPHAALASVVAVLGYALSIAATAALAAASVTATGIRNRSAERCTRVAIVGITTVVALGLLGVHAGVLAMALGLLAGVPLIAVSVSTALASRDVGSNLAAGRALRSHLRVGYRLETATVRGEIVALHPVTVEIETDDASVVHVPLRALLDEPFAVNPTRRGATR